MHSFRFLHAADLHLDSPFRGMVSLPSSIREYVIESTFLALQNMVEAAVSEEVDFIVLSGDIFDLSDRSLRAQIRFQEAMELLARASVQVFIIHGNHDPMDGRHAVLTWPETVHFFTSQEVEMKPAFNRKGDVVAHIYGISYPTAAVTENLAKRYQVQARQMYNIALLHCNVDGDPAHEHYAPCTKQDLITAGMQYWALGHVHTRQVLNTEPHIVYPGNIQGRSVRELGPRGCYVVDVSTEGKSELTFHRTDALCWFHQTLSIDQITTEQALTDLITSHMEEARLKAEGRPAIVRLSIEGRSTLHKMLQRDTEVQELLGIIREQQLRLAQQDNLPFVWLESMKVSTGIEVERDELLQQDSFLGDLLRISKELGTDEEQFYAFSEEALGALHAHPQAGKHLKAIPLEQQREWLRTAEELAIHLLFKDEEREH
jgi:exonuclease SbcD